MNEQYPTLYTDAHGSEKTTILNDGKTLKMVLRGINFEGTDFDSFEPVVDSDPLLLERFTLNQNMLCSCRIECEILIPVVSNEKESLGSLHCRIDLGPPGSNGGLESLDLKITLKHDAREYLSTNKSGWFEDELLDIQKQLPAGTYMKACINCLYSDYSPVGHGLFGCMMCFRNVKQDYLKVKSKADFWSVHDRCERFVQEIYLCEDFKKREPGTGYRG